MVMNYPEVHVVITMMLMKPVIAQAIIIYQVIKVNVILMKMLTIVKQQEHILVQKDTLKEVVVQIQVAINMKKQLLMKPKHHTVLHLTI